MRAIVLVGGEGTRLRPLTWRTPKPLVPVLNRPLIEHLLLHLHRHGVRRVTLAMSGRGEAIRRVLGDGSALGLGLDFAYEQRPLGSGGAIAHVGRIWREQGEPAGEPFVVLNGDILTDLDLGAMARAHRARRAEISIGLVRVDDPSAFGVAVLSGAGGRPEKGALIERFVEKPPPGSAPSRWANAGVWIFEPGLLDEMDPDRFHRVEEELFPSLAAAGRVLLGVAHEGSWRDVGTPAAYLEANLEVLRSGASEKGELNAGAEGRGPVLVGAGSRVDDGACLEGPAVVGERCWLAPGARVSRSVLWEEVRVAEGASVSGSVLASGSVVGAGACVRGAVLAHGARVPPGARVPEGTSLAPGATFAAGGEDGA